MRARRAGAFRGGMQPAAAGGERSEVRNLNVWAGGESSTSQLLPAWLLPSFLPSLSSSFLSPLPLFLIPAQPLSCLPDPRPSPPLAVTSKSKDKTHPHTPLPANP